MEESVVLVSLCRFFAHICSRPCLLLITIWVPRQTEAGSLNRGSLPLGFLLALIGSEKERNDLCAGAAIVRPEQAITNAVCDSVLHRPYALSADETSPALAAPRHAITALLSCRFKCPCPLRRQRHFHGNADRAYNTLHFASKVVCQGANPFGNP